MKEVKLVIQSRKKCFRAGHRFRQVQKKKNELFEKNNVGGREREREEGRVKVTKILRL